MNEFDKLLLRLWDRFFGITAEERERSVQAAERAWQEFHCGPEVVEAFDFQIWEKECQRP